MAEGVSGSEALPLTFYWLMKWRIKTRFMSAQAGVCHSGELAKILPVTCFNEFTSFTWVVEVKPGGASEAQLFIFWPNKHNICRY